MRKRLQIWHKGKLFYMFSLLLTTFIIVPLSAALVLSLGALRRAGDDSRRYFNAAMEAQIQYAQTTGFGRSHVKYIRELRREYALLTELGARTEMDKDAAFHHAETLLKKLVTVGPPDFTSWFFYFKKSGYLMGTEHPGIDARAYAPAHILSAAAGVDSSDTSYSRNRFGKNANGEYFLTYVSVVVPGVFFLYDREYGPGGMGSRLLPRDLTDHLIDLEIAYYDSYGSILPATQRQSATALYTYDSFGESSGSFKFKQKGRPYLGFYTYNADNRTKFVLFSRDSISEAYRTATFTLYAGALIVMASCLAFAVFFLRRTYSPLDALISRLAKEHETESIQDEVRLISDTLDTMDATIKKKNALLGSSYLLHIVKRQSTADFEGEMIEWFEHEGAYTVAIVRIDAAGNKAAPRETEFERRLLRFFLDAGYELKTAWDGDFLVTVFRMDVRSIDDITAYFRKFQRTQRDVTFSAYLGGPGSTIKELHRRYGEAMEAAEYCMLLEKYGSIQRYDELKGASRGIATVLPDFSQLQKLTDSIASLSSKEALIQYDEIAFRLAEGQGRGLRQEDLALSVLVNAIALAFYDIDLPGDFNKATIQNYSDRIRDAESVGNLRDELQKSLNDFCDLNAAQTDDQKQFEQVRDYIQKNFRDPNLYSGSVADHFAMSPSNITRMFKKYFRIGFLEFVHQLRVGEAVRLLEESQLSIAEIAARVGYTNKITMIRAFKTYAHSTPGMIRKLQKKNAPSP